MKKILTLALAAFMASAVCSAQSFGTKLSGKPQTKKVLPTMASQRINLPAPTIADDSKAVDFVAGHNNHKVSKAVSMQKKSTFTPVMRGVASAPRKELSMLEAYVGYGYSYFDKKNMKWAMAPGKTTKEGVEGEIDVLWDIIPTPALFVKAGIEHIPAEYTYDDATKTITIPAQNILEREYEDSTKTYILLFSILTEDGSIIINVGDDGSLTVNEDDAILYGDWDTPTIEYDDDDNYVGFNGGYQYMEKVQYFKPGEEPVYVPQPEYEPEGLFLHASISPSAYGFQNNLQFMPAYAQQSFKNFTTDEADAWSWKMDRLQVNAEGTDYEVGETFTAETRDFAIQTIDGTYTPAELVASFEGQSSDPYKWGLSHDKPGTKAYVYASFMGDNYDMSDGTYATISKCDPSNGFSLYTSLGTPALNSRGLSISSLILYQGKPATPFYFEGINLLCEQLTMEDNFELKCKIQKVSQDPATGALTLGDVIAEADINTDDVVQGYNENGWDIWQLNWNEFYVEDEYGFTETLPYIFVEDEFAIVFEGWNNGTFQAAALGEGSSNSVGVNCIYYQVADDDNVYGRFDLYSHIYAGFNGAIYGYLHTEDATTFNFGKEGGIGTMHIDPMLYNMTTNSETGEKTPSVRLFLDSITIDDEPYDYEVDEETGEDNLPEWLGIGIANLNEETETDDAGNVYPVTIDYDLMVGVEELTDAETRKVELVFMQEGGLLKVTINQGGEGDAKKGDVNGDGSVDVADISAVISQMAGSAEYATADVNGDGAVDVADISAIISIMAGN